MFPAPFLAVAQTWPFVVLATSMVFLIVAITRLRMHAFIALIAAAILAGLMAGNFTPDALQRLEFFKIKTGNHWVATLELAMLDFGKTAGDIAISIGLASIIGMALMESGAADKVVRRFLAFFGEQRAGIALLASTYFLSIPIFFDTMFMLMVPLARALRLRTGKDYVFYLMCICVAGVVTHSLTVPHPGPLKTVDTLRVDVGLSMWWGIVGGILPCIAGFFVARWIGRRVDVPLRETRGTSLDDLRGISAKPESDLPSFVASVLPILVPIGLISTASFYLLMGWKSEAIEFAGNKNIALLAGTLIALVLLARQKKLGFARIEELIGPPLETAGVIILITSAGGAFGAMLRNIGVGAAIQSAAQGYNVNILLLAWVTAAVIRIAQGSATVAMITSSAIIWDMLDPAKGGAPLPFNTMYVFLAIGFGAFCCSWMNDSGFWVVSRLGGMTERETLRSWTVVLTAASIAGFLLTLLFANILPLASLPAK
jgi:GntP family gluconate:H+ symporter